MGARILAFAGSTRRESYNKRLIRAAAAAARAAGGDVTLIDLADFPLPLFDEDVERQGTPELAVTLKEHFKRNSGLLIAAPEYNSSLTAVLKNALDWVSRPAPNEAPLAAFTGKTAAIMSASPGALGGLRCLVHLRAILSSIGVLVLPEQQCVSKAHEAFDEQGRLKEQRLAAGIERLCGALVKTVDKLGN